MADNYYDVVVVGGGAAGMTAAIGLARRGIAVAVVEAAEFPGAENWSGCVYFCENLAHPEILGPDGVESLSWERRVIERGNFATDGYGLLGLTCRDPDAYRHCYTVLRPIFDRHLAEFGVKQGVTLRANTTVEGLIREEGRVIGVSTNQGPFYADLVFLAEGDASSLVTREGYENSTDPRDAPKFLQGFKQVIELPADALEERFGLDSLQGAAYEIFLRNGKIGGRDARLNIRGFLYTNRQSLSLGLVVPLDSLRDQFGGDPRSLMDWYLGLPSLAPWLEGGQRGAFGCKLIRGGGARDIPTLIDDGLAIGGAATAIGSDFPYPNFTGPATAMGLLIARAVPLIRAQGGGFTRAALDRHYLEPLRQTHYWQDVQFLRNWPGYIKRSRVFFGEYLDLALRTAFVWTTPRRGPVRSWLEWIRLLMQTAGPRHWPRLRADFRHLARALHFGQAIDRPTLGRLLLDGTINALRDLAGSPRANIPAAGTVAFHFSVAGSAAPAAAPWLWRRWFKRFAPVLASAARRVSANDATPLAEKLRAGSRVLVRQINMLDLLIASSLALAAAITAGFLALVKRLPRLFWKPTRVSRGRVAQYMNAAARYAEPTSARDSTAKIYGDQEKVLFCVTNKTSHIHLQWPRSLQKRGEVGQKGLEHLCPTGVFEIHAKDSRDLRVAVHFERCIKCEACWRASDMVDWARDGGQRFSYQVRSSGDSRKTAAPSPRLLPASPTTGLPWEESLRQLESQLTLVPLQAASSEDSGEIQELEVLAAKLEQKLEEFDRALARGPSTIDKARAEYLEMLARYAVQLSTRMTEVLRDVEPTASFQTGAAAVHQAAWRLTRALLSKAEERERRTWDQHFAWAAADGRQIQQHHLHRLGPLLKMLDRTSPSATVKADATREWLRIEDHATELESIVAAWRHRLNEAFPTRHGLAIEEGVDLRPDQDALLRALIAQVPPIVHSDLARTLHPPLRKALLAELARRAPWLAYRVAAHLWARDLVGLRSSGSGSGGTSARWIAGEEWACFVDVNAVRNGDDRWSGQAISVPAAGASALLLLLGDHLVVVHPETPGVRLEPSTAADFAGAGLSQVTLENLLLPEKLITGDHARFRRVWEVISAADLTSLAFGMADCLTGHALEYSGSHVELPGEFQDEEARDTIGKFGAVKKHLADAAARRFLLETLDQELTPADFSAASVDWAGLVKVLATEALGTAPGSVLFCAEQIFADAGDLDKEYLSRLGRAASAWRLLGPPNIQTLRRHGSNMMRSSHLDDAGLTSLQKEAEFFDQVAQRKALQAELDEVRVLRSRLRGLIHEWHSRSDEERRNNRTTADLPKSGLLAAMAEATGRQDILLLGAKALLLRTHARLEHGYGAEVETALLRVWLDAAGGAADEFASWFRAHIEAAFPRSQRPVADPALGLALTSFDDFLAFPGHYNSGDFLVQPVSLARPRLIPDLKDGRNTWSMIRNRQTQSSEDNANLNLAELCLSAVSQFSGLIEHSRASATATSGQVPGWVAWRLSRMEVDRFIGEGLAYEFAGWCIHPGVSSPDMESAITKMLVVEMLDRVKAWAADIQGLAGNGRLSDRQSPDMGTLTRPDTVIQSPRFLILKALATMVPTRWLDASSPTGYLGQEVIVLESLRGDLRKRIQAALEYFGQGLWQNPNLQANCFLLSEATAWFKAADTVLGRLAWLDRRADSDDGADAIGRIELAYQALDDSMAEVRLRLEKFDDELARLRRGFYAPEIRAASLLLGEPPAGGAGNVSDRKI